jgi:hypothetical protein
MKWNLVGSILSIDFEVAGENWKVAGKLMWTARSSGINDAKSCILGLSWHLISLLELHFLVLFFSYILFTPRASGRPHQFACYFSIFSCYFKIYWQDASYQVSLHLAEGFHRRRLKCEKLTDDGHQVMAKAHIAFGKVSYEESLNRTVQISIISH